MSTEAKLSAHSFDFDRRWGRGEYISAALITLLCVLYALWQGWRYIFGPPVLETGDFAVNALQIINAGHLKEIYGNYSRWGFNHPGPFFFYVYSCGEYLFLKVLHVVSSPDQAHVLAGIILQSLCFGWAAGELRRIIGLLAVASFLVVAAWVAPHTGAALSSVWAPDVLLGPYFALLIGCISLSAGNFRALAMVVLMVCVLCHGHIAQPLTTLPMLAISLFLCFRLLQKNGISILDVVASERRLVLSVVLVVVIFLIPLFIDLFRCPNCNAKKIIDYIHQENVAPGWGQVFNYVSGYFFFDHHPEWISGRQSISMLTGRVAAMVAIVGLGLLLPRMLRKQFSRAHYLALRVMGLFVFCALVFSLAWAKRITGPLYEFNAFFVYSIVLAAYLSVLASVVVAVRSNSAIVGGVLALVLALAYPALARPASVMSGQTAVLDPVENLKDPPFIALLSQQSNRDWPVMATLALWLSRSGYAFGVSDNWTFMFGTDHAADISNLLSSNAPVQIWYVTDRNLRAIELPFDPSRFCRVTSQTAPADFDEGQVGLSDLLADCRLTIFGVHSPDKDRWGWTQGGLFAFQFVGRHVDGPIRIKMDVFPFKNRMGNRSQTAIFYVNDVRLGQANVDGVGELSIEVPPLVWNRSKIVTVMVSLPDASSTSDPFMARLGYGTGLGIKSFGIDYGDEADDSSGGVPDAALKK
jgi:hypothetical protein